MFFIRSWQMKQSRVQFLFLGQHAVSGIFNMIDANFDGITMIFAQVAKILYMYIYE